MAITQEPPRIDGRLTVHEQETRAIRRVAAAIELEVEHLATLAGESEWRERFENAHAGLVSALDARGGIR